MSGSFSSVDQLGNTVTINFPPQRIVSLVPSQTELLADLGLNEEVVGVTKFCVHPQSWKTKTRIGGTKIFHHDIIDRLVPDLIIGNKEENYRDGIEELRKKYPVWMSDIETLSDALSMIRAVGTLTGREKPANEMAEQIEQSFQYVRKFCSLRVLYLIWRKPWMAAGSNTFIDNMLSTIGLVNAVDSTRYPELDEITIRKIDPDVILLSSEPFPFKDKHQNELSLLCPRAKVIRVDGEMFSWYGSRLLRAPGYFETLRLA